MYAKVSKKGQVTIPKSIRHKLNIQNDGAVLFIVENGEVKLKGIPAKSVEELAGSLKAYAGKYRPVNQIRKEIKSKIAEASSREGLEDDRD